MAKFHTGPDDIHEYEIKNGEIFYVTRTPIGHVRCRGTRKPAYDLLLPDPEGFYKDIGMTFANKYGAAQYAVISFLLKVANAKQISR